MRMLVLFVRMRTGGARACQLLDWSFVKRFVLNIQGQKNVAVSVIFITPSLLRRRVGGGRHCHALEKFCWSKQWLISLSAQKMNSDDDDNFPPQMRQHNVKERVSCQPRRRRDQQTCC